MVSPELLLDKAYNEIRKNIQTGFYPPGHKLVTQEISDALGISRTPVVSAINRLIAEDLAVAVPRRGVFVAQLSAKKIRNLHEVRKMIELYVIQPAIKNLDFYPEKIKEMYDLVDGLENLEDTDYQKAGDLDLKFHTLYVSLANNEQLSKVYESNRGVGATYYMYSMTKMPLTRQKRIYQEHRNLLDRLVERDEEGMREILDTLLASPIEALEWLLENDSENFFVK